VYPASFNDSNGDGIGDIRGIIEKLDYLKNLGIDVVWLSPHYKSPQKDMGYDISDYKDIDPRYGTVKECDLLIHEVHRRGMKIIFDLVVNHTSNEHEWFKESRKSKDNPKRDWYIWRPPKFDEHGNRQPPNNWSTFFHESAWEWDETTQEYYLHLFVKEQPDLNWENLEMRQAIYQDAIVYWLEKGVDGFRIDTVAIYSKQPGLPDAPITDPNSPYQHPAKLIYEGPQLHEILREMHDIGWSKYNAMTVGEGGSSEEANPLRFAHRDGKELNMMYTFDMLYVGRDRVNNKEMPWKLTDLKKAAGRNQYLVEEAWPTTFLENHDSSRCISRHGDESYWEESGKLFAILTTTLSGTIFVYQGQEIGMLNFPDTWTIDDLEDVEAHNLYKEVKERTNGDAKALKSVMDNLRAFGRDNNRTPMQWDGSINGGFTAGKPWLKVNPNYRDINVEKQSWDPYSILAFYRHMLRFRKQYADSLIRGKYKEIYAQSEDIFCYFKQGEMTTLFVAMNFTDKTQPLVLPQNCDDDNGKNLTYRLLLTSVTGHVDGNLQPYEGAIYLATAT
jgi:glycosidase